METPQFFQSDYHSSPFPPEKRLSDAKTIDHFVIDDLLDFSNHDAIGPDADDSSTATPLHTSSTPFVHPTDVAAQFSNDLCVPYEDMAELEWLSSFADESFSSEDLQKLQLIQGVKARTNEAPQPEPAAVVLSVPAKARSKRSRAAPGNWTSRLMMVSPPVTSEAPAMSSSSESSGGNKRSPKPPGARQRRKDAPESSGEGRRCLHCATDKTPQWRTGPMGPKTLCNACGVRYKSGRLVPEYRPAASPTFVMMKHSNSHRKVMELRRQKEMVQAQQQFLHHQHQGVMFDAAAADDYLIHQQIGPDFRQLI
ncbi:hypothetical protein SASPL_150931 [Salvia splendens]|uniref:GATA transcription factor n=1 Tax=Salvia splendens TaxID=180675 RepID=A0A8X8W7P0_SALSN|nr:GATA transcription factor 12-like [Salvia splendens]KAG6389463.1 hypothetical protein SASPL_150931 [Salvia splendens]